MRGVIDIPLDMHFMEDGALYFFCVLNACCCNGQYGMEAVVREAGCIGAVGEAEAKIVGKPDIVKAVV